MMKKLFALLLALCLMLTFCAMAEEIEYPIVEEDDLDEDGLIDQRYSYSEDYMHNRYEYYEDGLLYLVQLYDEGVGFTHVEEYAKGELFAYYDYEYSDEAPEGYERVVTICAYDETDALLSYKIELQNYDEFGDLYSVCSAFYLADGTLLAYDCTVYAEELGHYFGLTFDPDGNLISFTNFYTAEESDNPDDLPFDLSAIELPDLSVLTK